jgi:hypothetical protein
MVELSSRAADARHVDTYAVEVTARVVLQGARWVGVGGEQVEGAAVRSAQHWREGPIRCGHPHPVRDRSAVANAQKLTGEQAAYPYRTSGVEAESVW